MKTFLLACAAFALPISALAGLYAYNDAETVSCFERSDVVGFLTDDPQLVKVRICKGRLGWQIGEGEIVRRY